MNSLLLGRRIAPKSPLASLQAADQMVASLSDGTSPSRNISEVLADFRHVAHRLRKDFTSLLRESDQRLPQGELEEYENRGSGAPMYLSNEDRASGALKAAHRLPNSPQTDHDAVVFALNHLRAFALAHSLSFEDRVDHSRLLYETDVRGEGEVKQI